MSTVKKSVNPNGAAAQAAAASKTAATNTAAPTTNAATTGTVSQYDREKLSPSQQAEIEYLSAQAKQAAASGNPNPSYHARAEEIRATAGYSGGADGSQYIELPNRPTPSASGVTTAPANTMRSSLDAWLAAAQQQQTNAIDYATNKAVTDLERAKEDAEVQFQEQRNQVDIQEAQAKDNQALYAERRGDKGGIGAAQYDSIMNTAAQNRLKVSQSQQKLATDTARQIADLRAQGAYEKADALLSLSQQYLSQLMSLEQWAAEYGLSVQQFNASLEQWAKEYDLAVSDVTGYFNGAPTLAYQESQRQQLASAGETLLAAGIMPSESQLAALGLTASQAQSYITAVKLAAASKGRDGNTTETTATKTMFEQMYDAGIKDEKTALAWLTSTGKYTSEAQIDLARELAADYMAKYGSGEFQNAISWSLQQKGYKMNDPNIWNDTRVLKDGSGNQIVQIQVTEAADRSQTGKSGRTVWYDKSAIEAGIREGLFDVVPDVRTNTITIIPGVRK